MADIVDRANDLAEHALMRALADQARKQASQPSTGTCADCDEPIGAERMRAIPFAQRCICCQSVHEKETR